MPLKNHKQRFVIISLELFYQLGFCKKEYLVRPQSQDGRELRLGLISTCSSSLCTEDGLGRNRYAINFTSIILNQV